MDGLNTELNIFVGDWINSQEIIKIIYCLDYRNEVVIKTPDIKISTKINTGFLVKFVFQNPAAITFCLRAELDTMTSDNKICHCYTCSY